MDSDRLPAGIAVRHSPQPVAAPENSIGTKAMGSHRVLRCILLRLHMRQPVVDLCVLATDHNHPVGSGWIGGKFSCGLFSVVMGQHALQHSSDRARLPDRLDSMDALVPT